MLTLDKLPLPVLLHILDSFPSLSMRDSDTRTVKIRLGVEMPLKLLANEVRALAYCNRALRRQLLPIVFADIAMGTLDDDKPNDTEFEKLASLASTGDETLACVRTLNIGTLTPRGVVVACDCITKMPGLEILGWVGQHPIPPAIAQALNNVPSFTTVVLRRFGVDSLPSLGLLASKITKLEFETERQAPLVEEVLELCPDMPGLQRRAKMAWNEHNVATLEEHRETFFRHLSALLSKASAHLEELSIDGHGLLQDDKPFPWLQRLFDAMIDDNRQIDSPGLATLAAPSRPLPSLQEFCYCMETNVSCVDIVNGITQNSPLRILQLGGARPTDIRNIFGPLFRCSDTLRELEFHGANGSFTMSHVHIIVAACPNLMALGLKGHWQLEAADLLEALEPLRELRRLTFDHPWEKPRDFPWPSPDGRTIRSMRNGDFRIISVMGTSFEEEMGRRIRADIDAVRPTYQERFKSFAEQMPALKLVHWLCTEVVVWTWRFERLPGKYGQDRVICWDNAYIPYEDAVGGPKVEGAGVYMTAPAGM
ncbi:hypothetical protein JCM8115_000807 [Rhodotorula mucilaginosa]